MLRSSIKMQALISTMHATFARLEFICPAKDGKKVTLSKASTPWHSWKEDEVRKMPPSIIACRKADSCQFWAYQILPRDDPTHHGLNESGPDMRIVPFLSFWNWKSGQCLQQEWAVLLAEARVPSSNIKNITFPCCILPSILCSEEKRFET